jgi:hypothetical protein
MVFYILLNLYLVTMWEAQQFQGAVFCHMNTILYNFFTAQDLNYKKLMPMMIVFTIDHTCHAFSSQSINHSCWISGPYIQTPVLLCSKCWKWSFSHFCSLKEFMATASSCEENVLQRCTSVSRITCQVCCHEQECPVWEDIHNFRHWYCHMYSSCSSAMQL